MLNIFELFSKIVRICSSSNFVKKVRIASPNCDYISESVFSKLCK